MSTTCSSRQSQRVACGRPGISSISCEWSASLRRSAGIPGGSTDTSAISGATSTNCDAQHKPLPRIPVLPSSCFRCAANPSGARATQRTLVLTRTALVQRIVAPCLCRRRTSLTPSLLRKEREVAGAQVGADDTSGPRRGYDGDHRHPQTRPRRTRGRRGMRLAAHRPGRCTLYGLGSTQSAVGLKAVGPDVRRQSLGRAFHTSYGNRAVSSA